MQVCCTKLLPLAEIESPLAPAYASPSFYAILLVAKLLPLVASELPLTPLREHT